MFVLWAIRFFLFQVYESPKYLMGCGQDEAAVKTVHAIAAYNGKESSLTLEHLLEAERSVLSHEAPNNLVKESRGDSNGTAQNTALPTLRKSGFKHIKALFETKKLAWNTSLLIVLWGKKTLRYCF